MPRQRTTNPYENLNSYIMIRGGIDRHERMMDVEFFKDIADSAKKMASLLRDTLAYDLDADLARDINLVLEEYKNL